MKPSTARVFALLRLRGVDGLSPDEARRWAGCDRLAARVSELRAEGHERPRPYADWAPGELAEAFGK